MRLGSAHVWTTSDYGTMQAMSEIFLGLGGDGENQNLALSRANRHGLIAGATGTGKTVTLQGLAESFSAQVF